MRILFYYRIEININIVCVKVALTRSKNSNANRSFYMENIYAHCCTVNNDLGIFTLYSFNDPVPQAAC